MVILDTPVRIDDLAKIASDTFGDLVKAVVDIERELIAIDAELHSDLEALLLEDGSRQEALWGINIYPGLTGDDLVEFDSMINIRPGQGNPSRGVDDETVRSEILAIVHRWVTT
jgi:hypothetical protein